MVHRPSFIAEKVTGLKERPDNSVLLELYGLYKQGSEGDIKGERPGLLDVKGRAKFDAWKKLAGTSTGEAQAKYVQLVKSLIAKD